MLLAWRCAAEAFIPCSRSRRSRAARSASSVVSMPPSPVVTILRGWKDQAASSAPWPTGLPPTVAPMAQAASSTRARSQSAQAARRASTSAGTPPWCTSSTARVRGVRTASTLARGEVAGAQLDIGEDRFGAGVADRVGGGDEGQRGHHHLVAGAEAERDQGQVQRGGAGTEGDGVLRADPLGEGPFEGGDPGALGDPAGAHRLGGGLGLLLAQPGHHHRDPLGHARTAASTCARPPARRPPRRRRRRARPATSRPGRAARCRGRSRR